MWPIVKATRFQGASELGISPAVKLGCLTVEAWTSRAEVTQCMNDIDEVNWNRQSKNSV